MLTKKQIEALRILQSKSRSVSGKKFVDRRGVDNLVARVRKTRKGKEIGFVSDGARKEASGIDGRAYYTIRRALDGQGTGLHLYCSCPAQRFHAGYGKPCKHIKKLVDEAVAILTAGENSSENRDLILYAPEAIAEAIRYFGGDTAELQEVV